MHSVSDFLARSGGSATTAELIRVTTRHHLNAAVRLGEVERIARGVYALPTLEPAKLAALAYDGVVAYLSAAALWRLPLLVLPDKPHIIVPAKRRPRAGRPAVLHWAEVSADERRHRVTGLDRTVVDCCRILPFGQALAIADAALRSGNLNSSELNSAIAAMRGAGCPMALRVATAASALAESFLESVLRSLLIEAGIEGFELQVQIEHDGIRMRVDLGHRVLRIALEAEGYEFHGSAPDYAADCRRYDNLVAAGWLVLRFTYHQVLRDPVWVIDVIRQAIALRTGHIDLAPTARNRGRTFLRSA
ncbi:type IV toxin-antitoxin system AbiEi family antitoxin domain-containing protein [Kribbella yunnanensis]|uniref:Type IV toxin-antitoxin system AbiEi family antitoxin domain-containing protein n=1 Tax=Kribbella yunnanensis TaxID=190194 RepID=A0ABP4UC97_9ACTN